MKELALKGLAALSAVTAKNLLRERLQARILLALQRRGAMARLAFHGGTALRFLFDLPRFSEDLDFALEGGDGAFDLAATAADVARDLHREGYEVELRRLSTERAVASVFVTFRGLLHEAGITGRRDALFRVKIEVDRHPPRGARCVTSVVRRHALLNLHHHDRASLFAGKLHALLQRPYTKGRDLFDLLWYLADRSWPEPNLALLAAALEQSGWTGPSPTTENWRGLVAPVVERADWGAVRREMEPFLEDPAQADGLDGETLLGLLSPDRAPRPPRGRAP